jgi:hypothetical protein
MQEIGILEAGRQDRHCWLDLRVLYSDGLLALGAVKDLRDGVDS